MYSGPYQRPQEVKTVVHQNQADLGNEHSINVTEIKEEKLVALIMSEYKKRPLIARIIEVDLTEWSAFVHWQGARWLLLW